jgi:hypothetical protein
MEEKRLSRVPLINDKRKNLIKIYKKEKLCASERESIIGFWLCPFSLARISFTQQTQHEKEARARTRKNNEMPQKIMAG